MGLPLRPRIGQSLAPRGGARRACADPGKPSNRRQTNDARVRRCPLTEADGRGARDAVTVAGLVVRYDAVVALDGIDLTVSRGEALGIVGPNGAGKSTILKTVAGLVTPASGDVRVFGKHPRDLKPGSIAYVPQVEAVDWSFPANVRDIVAMGRFPKLRPLQRFGKHDRAAVDEAL